MATRPEKFFCFFRVIFCKIFVQRHRRTMVTQKSRNGAGTHKIHSRVVSPFYCYAKFLLIRAIAGDASLFQHAEREFLKFTFRQ
jgi:hypothetical protein